MLIIGAWLPSRAQESTLSSPSNARDTSKIVYVLHTDKQGFRRVDSLTDLQFLVGNVAVKQGSTRFYTDSAVSNNSLKIIEAFGHVHINDADSVHTHSEYLRYHTDTKITELKKNVQLTDGKTTLTTEELEYDLNQKIGNYHNGGKVVSGQSVLTSRDGTYYADQKDIYFRNNVVLKDPRYTLHADSLLYNTNTQTATFITETRIVDSSGRTMKTREGYYDLKNKKAVLSKRPVITDKGVTVIADSVDTDDSSGISKLRGHAIYKDTAEGVAVTGNYIEAMQKQGSFMAVDHPVMIIKQDKDSIYIAGDTLFSGRLSSLEKDTIRKVTVVDAGKQANDSSDRYFKAYHHVKIFSDSLQAVCDSLFYSGKDSIFRLFRNPVMWASGSQITGDTIFVYTKNKKADHMYVFENAFAINKAGEEMFNQIRGNRMYGYFREGEIDYMRAKGNAESIYYVKDEKGAVTGVNKAASDIIDMRFKDKELNRVVFISEPQATMYPVRQLTDENKKLRAFRWQENIRPKTKAQLFSE